MVTEERLVNALRRADAVDPSDDLWTRVVHSIEEDDAHRTRVRRTFAGLFMALALIAITIATGTVTTPAGGRVLPWQLAELLETIALIGCTVALGPAIRRFGRGYAGDLLHSGDAGDRMIRVLDAAYYLVFAGYILSTARFAEPLAAAQGLLGLQIYEMAARVGGLALLMGVLHGATMMALPLLALVRNSTNAGRRLPRWVLALTLLWLVVSILAVGPFTLTGLMR